MEITHLKKLLQKALLYRLMINIDRLISEADIPHATLSLDTGSSKNWFNDAYNNNEDIRISSLAKILTVINASNKIDDYKVCNLFDENVLSVTDLLIRSSYEEKYSVSSFIKSDKELFSDLITDWGLLDAKKKLTSSEKEYLTFIRNLVFEEENK